jgi:hypothetical protein
MNIEIIDEAIDRYVHERMSTGHQKARERFLANVYLKLRGDDIVDFFKKTSGLSRYYINYLKVMQNPLKGPECAWFASMLAIAIYAVMLMTTDDELQLGVFLLVGTVINAGSLICNTTKKWCDMGVMIAIYRELAQIAEAELGSRS